MSAMTSVPRAGYLALVALLPLLMAADGPPPWQVPDPVPKECVGGIPLAMRRLQVSAQYSSAVTALAWSADGQRLASISGFAGQIDIWDRSGQRVQQFKFPLGTLEALAFPHDDNFLVTSRTTPDPANNGIALNVWNVTTGAVVRQVPGPVPGGPRQQNRSQALAISANGRVAGSLASSTFASPVQLYDAETWDPIGTVVAPPRDIPASFTFSPDGNRIALGTYGGRVVLFDTHTQRELLSFQVYAGLGNGIAVNKIAFNPDGTLLATGPNQNFRRDPPWPNLRMIHIWRVADGGMVRTYEGNFGPVRGLSWSPDGRFLATASSDGPVRIWSTQRDGPPCVATDNFPPSAWPVAFSPDSGVLAAGGSGGIVLFDLSK